MAALVPVFMFTDIMRIMRYLGKRMAAHESVKVCFCVFQVFRVCLAFDFWVGSVIGGL
jgi:hypothetical protein